MGSMSLTHWLIFGVIVLILFGGGGKISSIMGDVAKGIKSFKKGMQDDETAQKPADDGKVIEAQKVTSPATAAPVSAQATPVASPPKA